MTSMLLLTDFRESYDNLITLLMSDILPPLLFRAYTVIKLEKEIGRKSSVRSFLT